jgi:hypothetical protein
MSQQGSVVRYDHITGNNYSVKPTHPDPNVTLRFNWNAAINMDPFDNSTLYFGSQFVHKSTDKGLTWNIISDDLTTNDKEKQKQGESGGLTMDATGAENHTTILVIEPSKIEKDLLWTGSDDGRVHITKNGGTTWKDVSANIPELPKGSWIAQIKASNKNKGEALLIANDYRRFNYTPYAYRTKDYGANWSRIVDENDVKSYTLSIVEDPINANLLFLGTDDGLYVSLDAGNQWNKWTAGFPTVSTKDLVIQSREHDLVIGTFGRAAWVLDDIRPLRAMASGNVFDKKLQLFTPPTAYQAAYQQPTGSRFGGDALFNGENKKSGAMISYYINRSDDASDKKVEKSTKNKKKRNKTKKITTPDPSKEIVPEVKYDSIKLEIFDGSRLIRTLKQKAPKENGIHRMYWSMNERGADRPSRKIRKRNFEPGGVSVKPGTYNLKMTFGDQTSESSIKVEYDPRLEMSTEAIAEIYNVSKDLEKDQQLMADIVKQLAESKQTATGFKKDLDKEDKKKYKDQIKLSKDIINKIDDLLQLF